ncbi:MAG: DHHW family protein [Bacteroidota bacterium]|nr:DHHW family protein [Bacteroidota bacterium]
MKNKRREKSRNAYITTIGFGVVLAVVGIYSLIQPKQKYSPVDNRDLAVMPEPSSSSFFSGFYLHAVDSVYADNFPFRDDFVSGSIFAKSIRGYHPKKIGFYQTTNVEQQVPVDVDTTIAKVDSIPSDSADNGPSETSGGVVIYDGRAMELFGGNNNMAKLYAAMVNKYQEELNGKATIYVAAVPSSIAFYPPSEYRKMAASEKNNIDQIYSNLSPGIRAVNAYDEIAAHRSQYIYFGTDHHWTGLGAYYAYVAFCKSAALTPIALDAMTHKVKKKYYGSLYFLTHDERLRENPDSVEYWMVPGKHTTLRYGTSLGKGMAGSLYAQGASGGNSYGVFLGGDNPLMRIDNDIKNGRKCVIVKNSYGNPFATYFTANYETVFVVDYRYYNGSLLNLINDNQINDVIFINGVFSANTSWHIKMMTKIMKGSGTNKPKPPKSDSIPKDADTIRNNVNDSLKNKALRKGG